MHSKYGRLCELQSKMFEVTVAERAHMIKKWISVLKKRKTAMTVATILVVFVTTYMLIMPAITVEKSTAGEEVGIVLDQGASNESDAEAVTVEKDVAGSAAGDIGTTASGTGTATDNGSASGSAAVDDTSASIEEAGALSMPAQDFEQELKEEKITVSVKAEEGALPEGTEMKVEAVDDKDVLDKISEEAEKKADKDATISEIQALDISFWYAGEEIEPENSVYVTIASEQIKDAEEQAPMIVHINDEDSDKVADNQKGKAEIVKAMTDKELKKKDITLAEDEIAFEAEQFSVYALVYTVDFHREEDGRTYDFSMPGGAGISIRDLVTALGIAEDDPTTENDEVGEFLNNIAGVSFSNPELVWLGSVVYDNTIADIKEYYALKCEYSAELTDEDIAGINAREVRAGEWAIISLCEFDTEESLSIIMKSGEEISVKVTDAQGGGSISVSKVLEYPEGMNKINGERIYFALVKDGEYVTDSNNKIVYKEMFMQGDFLNPSTVTFTGLEDGDYEVWEMHGDPNNGSLNRSYDGMLLNNETAQLDKIRVIANSNGMQSANGLYNNNASIRNGSAESMTFRNTYKPASGNTNFEANKVWMDRKEHVIQAPEDATIVFTLFKEINGVTTPAGKTIVLNGIADDDGEENPWQAVFKDLPKTENGQQVKYKVKETTGWPDYYICKNKGKNLMGENEYLESSGGTIYNRHLLATIQIQKHFDIQPNKYTEADWAEVIAKKQLSFELTNETTNETWYFTLDDTFTRDGQLFYLNVPDMQAGHYVLKEYRYKGLITDRKWDRGITEFERDINPGDNMDNPLFEMEVQNWYVAGQDEPEGAYIKALKVWDDLDDFDQLRPASVTVKLNATVNGASYELPATVTNPVTLSEDNGWSTQDAWYNLPISDEHNNKIEYSIEEVDVPAGYESNITKDTNGTDISYTITNTHRPEGAGSLKLKKIVNAPVGAPVPNTYYFTVKDTEGKYYTGHSVSGPDGYYTAIPIQAGTGEGEDEILLPAGTYTVSEIRNGIEVPAYTLTVTGEGDYTVEAGKTTTATITNTYEGLPENAIKVQKKWKDPDGNTVSGDGKTATVQLRRYHYVSDSGGTPSTKTVSVTIEFPVQHDVWINGIHYDDYQQPSKVVDASITGNSVKVSISDTGGIEYYYDSEWTKQFHNGASIDFSGTSNLTLYANRTWASASNITSISIDGGGSGSAPTYTLTKDTSFTPAVTILSAPDWSHTWTIGGTDTNHSGFDYPATDENGNKYLYYIEELDENGYVVSVNGTVSDGVTLESVVYQPSLTETENAGITTGLVTVTNRIDDHEETTLDVDIIKVDADDNTKKLNGAKFELYRYDNIDDNSYTDSKAEAEVDANGKLTFKDLTEGFYKLVETKSPDGYIKTEADPWFHVKKEVDGTLSVEVVEGFEKVLSYSSADKAILVKNEPGAALPSTGGPGTRLFTILGSILILGAGVLLWRRRRLI